MRLKQILLESVGGRHQLRKQTLKIYKEILRNVCQRKVDIDVDLAWGNIQHLYGELLGSNSDITYDGEVVKKYGVHDAPWIAKVDLNDIFKSDVLDFDLMFSVGEMYHGGVYYEPKDYLSTSISDDQSEIMRKFFSGVSEENWSDKEKFKDVVYDYICENFPKHKNIFLHEMTHFFKKELEEDEVRFQELVFRLEDKFNPEDLRERFKNFDQFKSWFFGEFNKHEEWGSRIDLKAMSREDKEKLVSKLLEYWKWKIDD